MSLAWLVTARRQFGLSRIWSFGADAPTHHLYWGCLRSPILSNSNRSIVTTWVCPTSWTKSHFCQFQNWSCKQCGSTGQRYHRNARCTPVPACMCHSAADGHSRAPPKSCRSRLPAMSDWRGKGQGIEWKWWNSTAKTLREDAGIR